MDKLKFIIAGGGTGGHLFPALAIGEELNDRVGANIHYVGSTYGIEAEKLPASNFKHTLLPIRGLQRGFSVSSLRKNLFLPWRLLMSRIKINSLVDEYQPDAVIGTGGYASALPLYIARHKNIPYFIQEQNSYPGMTTRYFAEDAETVFTAFEEVEKHIKKKTLFRRETRFEKTLRMGIA